MDYVEATPRLTHQYDTVSLNRPRYRWAVGHKDGRTEKKTRRYRCCAGNHTKLNTVKLR